MKKIITVATIAFSFIFLFGAVQASASSLWNGASNDCQSINIGDFTAGTGFGSPCWNGSSISANPGDAINVIVWYHNSSDLTGSSQTATNAKITVNAQTASSTNHSFSAQISSDQGSISTGQVNVTTTAAQTLAFDGVRIYKNQSVSAYTLAGSEVFAGGVSLGDIAPGWNSQGSIVLTFHVSQNSTPTLCKDTSAQNYNGALPCTYYTAPTLCKDTSAQNYNGYLPCTYYVAPTLCKDTSAQNYNGYLPCTYYTAPTVCRDSSATNYGGYLPCTYYTQQTLCRDTSATNYNGYLPCNYYVAPTLCRDSSATNYNSYLPCTYYVAPQPVYNACAITTVATNIGTSTATLNGLVTNPSGGFVSSYFQYGPTVNLGLTTASLTTNSNYSQVIGGLSPDTIYYFRSVAQCGSGLSYGKIEVLNTTSIIPAATNTTTTRTIYVQGTTVTGTASPIMLTIEDRYQTIGAGDTIDYTVTYKNIGKSLLTHPVLQVVIPKGITLTNSSAGTYSKDTNTLTVPLNDLKPGDGGVIYLSGHIDSIASGAAQIVTTAILVYTSPSGAQENAIAYVLNNPRDFGNLGAAAFFSGFGGIGIIGWLLLLILILLIILETRSYRKSTTVHKTDALGLNTTTTTTTNN
jgi:uncharacterized repeat protein (TIGR01451 family)